MTLNDLALKYKTDKASTEHDYCHIYESYLLPFKDKRISLIELGAGGYHYEDRGGESLRMWYDYFRNGKIIGVDLYNKKGLINDRTEFWQGHQDNEHLLQTIIEREAGADVRVFIDDASHINELTIKSFQITFPLLKSGDFYFSEDLHCSYWDEHFSGNPEPGRGITAMNYFTHLAHQLNDHVLLPEFQNEFAGKIEFVHFYRELVVLKRK